MKEDYIQLKQYVINNDLELWKNALEQCSKITTNKISIILLSLIILILLLLIIHNYISIRKLEKKIQTK